jgi:hypothetical protein
MQTFSDDKEGVEGVGGRRTIVMGREGVCVC